MDSPKYTLTSPKSSTPKVLVVTQFSYRVMDATLFKSITLMIEFYDANGARITHVMYKIDGDDYQNWGKDDQYVIDLINQKVDTILADF